MKIDNVEVHGLCAAARAMRNPMDSWDYGDLWGKKDRTLLRKLCAAGTEHRKAIRLVQCWMTIDAPRYWWTEFDTYKVGVTRMSCSTMHTLTKMDLTEAHFADGTPRTIIEYLRAMIEGYRTLERDDDKAAAFGRIKAALPEGFIQRADVVCSYEALANMHRQRKAHRLPEWRTMCTRIESLPLMGPILGIDAKETI
jgi:hypothetical protein